ncbi:uncharacterized protein EI90DRAFT_3014102 [Cantharellus anzutake]|uniref:uncharacterized protein n=1 Tax=Cantharellus anzutake TaxID=1750568 RepID=UPI0019069C69|nr:uncharacterized protein EI90DRAFT_3014102 [Cantharellus anzutake]KAF8336307.1 hypothetical protein EI90DRAFT_3014102 [Cantharellus anzutake]
MKPPIITINLLKLVDTRFTFLSGNKTYAFKNKISKNAIGTRLCFLFLGIIKCAKQYGSNFAIDLIPLTCQAFINACVFIYMFSNKNVKNININYDSVPMSAFTGEEGPFKTYMMPNLSVLTISSKTKILLMITI